MKQKGFVGIGTFEKKIGTDKSFKQLEEKRYGQATERREKAKERARDIANTFSKGVPSKHPTKAKNIKLGFSLTRK